MLNGEADLGRHHIDEDVDGQQNDKERKKHQQNSGPRLPPFVFSLEHEHVLSHHHVQSVGTEKSRKERS
jgi:hypothetical protein